MSFILTSLKELKYIILLYYIIQMNCKDALEKLENIKTQRRQCQAKYTNLHRDEINERRRKAYASKQLALGNKIIQRTTFPNAITPVILTPIELPTIEPVNIQENITTTTVTTKSKAKKPKKLIIVEDAMSFQEADLELLRLRKENIIKSDSSLKTDKNNLKQIQRITESNELVSCIKDSKTLISKILNAKKINGQPYEVASIKSMLQTVLNMIRLLKINVSTKVNEEYAVEFQLYKNKNEQQTLSNKKTEVIPTYDEYLKMAKEKYGENSKLYIIALLARELAGVRDDLGLHVVKKDLKDATKNYIVVPKSGNLSVKINHFKTAGKHDPYFVILSTELSKIIRQYIANQKIKNEDFLFGTEYLTDYISKINKNIGPVSYKGGMGIFRNMIATDSSDKTEREQILVSNSMKHSTKAHQGYIKK